MNIIWGQPGLGIVKINRIDMTLTILENNFANHMMISIQNYDEHRTYSTFTPREILWIREPEKTSEINWPHKSICLCSEYFLVSSLLFTSISYYALSGRIYSYLLWYLLFMSFFNSNLVHVILVILIFSLIFCSFCLAEFAFFCFHSNYNIHIRCMMSFLKFLFFCCCCLVLVCSFRTLFILWFYDFSFFICFVEYFVTSFKFSFYSFRFDGFLVIYFIQFSLRFSYFPICGPVEPWPTLLKLHIYDAIKIREISCQHLNCFFLWFAREKEKLESTAVVGLIYTFEYYFCIFAYESSCDRERVSVCVYMVYIQLTVTLQVCLAGIKWITANRFAMHFPLAVKTPKNTHKKKNKKGNWQ